MAEAAGLVLGGIALVGLVSTCVEIAEYLESAKNRAGDFKMALTKVNLIKQRLRAWVAALSVDMAPYPQSNHTIAPTECGVLIEETLFRIKLLLDKTNRMSQRHCLRNPNHQWDLNPHSGSRLPSEKLHFRSHSVISDTSLPTDGEASFEAGHARFHARFPQLLLSFPLKVLWVFQDRKRFDNVIEQLDFLLSNLEKISETLPDRSEMPQSNTSKQRSGPSARNPDEKSQEPDPQSMGVGENQPRGHAPQEYSNRSRGDARVVNTPKQSKPHSDGTDRATPLQTTDQGGDGCAPTDTSVGHQFNANEARDESRHFQGNIGNDSEGGPPHNFTKCISHNKSTMASGNIDHQSLGMLMGNGTADKKDL